MDGQPAVRVDIDDTSVQEMFGRAQVELKTKVRQLIEGAAIDIQREMRLVAPVAVTGDLRKSVRYSFSVAQLRAEVSPNVPYARDVERGGKPRYESVKPGSSLRKWAELKGLNPYAVRNSIAKKGTKPHPFVEPTYDKMKPKVEADVRDGIASMVEGLNR